MASPLIVPVNEIPKHELWGIDKVREMIPQRYEMEQLTGILLFDRERGIAIGYRDVSSTDFWVRGHIPGRPLMPGVLMCEAAAQLCSFCYRMTSTDAKDSFLGFGGMDNVRFRGTVLPGDRFIIIVKSIKLDARLKIFEAQGLVGDKLVFEAKITGIRV